MTTPGAPSWFVTGVGNFNAVKQACINGGGELATINSLADNDIAVDLCPDSVCYIGLVRDSAGNTPWYWLSGYPVVYSNWVSNQILQTNEMRSRIIKSSGKWEDWGTGWWSFRGVCRVMCLHCPPNSLSLEASTTLSACQCNGGYTGANGASCTICAAGTYKLNSNPGTCQGCPSFSTSVAGSSALTACQCNAGYTGANGGACSICAAGTYKLNSNPGRISGRYGRSGGSQGPYPQPGGPSSIRHLFGCGGAL